MVSHLNFSLVPGAHHLGLRLMFWVQFLDKAEACTLAAAPLGYALLPRISLVDNLLRRC